MNNRRTFEAIRSSRLSGICFFSSFYRTLLPQFEIQEKWSIDDPFESTGREMATWYRATIAGRSILLAPLATPDISYTQLLYLIELIRTIRNMQLHTALLLTHQQGRERDHGRFAIVEDHINLTGKNPLVGFQRHLSIPMFPDMSQVYPEDLQQILRVTVESQLNISSCGSGAILVGIRKGYKLLSRERQALSNSGRCYFTYEGIIETIIMGALELQIAGLIYSGGPHIGTFQLMSSERLSLLVSDLVHEIL